MPDPFRRCGAVFALLVAAVVCWPSPARAQPVDVEAGSVRQVLREGVDKFEDRSGALGLDAVRALPPSAWARVERMPLNLGYSTSAWWLRVPLHSREATPIDRLLEVASPLQDYVDLAWVGGDGAVHVFPSTGDRMPFSRRMVAYSTPLFPLEIGAEGGVAYIRLATHDGLHEPVVLSLWEPETFLAKARTQALWHGACWGMLLLLLSYSLILWIWSRQCIFLKYCGYLTAALGWGLTFTGEALQYLWPSSAVFNNQLLPLLIATAYMLGMEFLLELVQLKAFSPPWHRGIRVLSLAALACALPSLFGFYAAAVAFSLPLSALTGAIFLCMAGDLVRQGSRQALWCMVAWSTVLLAVLVYVLGLAGWLPVIEGINDVLLIGVALQAVLLGVGLADAAERLRRGKVAAERAAREAQEEQSARLEQQVKERTSALQLANQRLNELAITDALTGVFNRRHFNEALEYEVARYRREGLMPALCLIDVDHFKAYNDLYGHARGDAVLQAVARTVAERLSRADDRLFRVGGEEFAIILRPGDPELQVAYIDGLRAAIESLALPHRGNEPGVVTASFGLALDASPGAVDHVKEAAALYREADRLLYRAKAAGRNRVERTARPAAEWANSTIC